jgi:P pilus assembly chaperone PapD
MFNVMRALIAVLMCVYVTPCSSGISVLPAMLDMTSKSKRQDIRVTNTGDKTAYIQTKTLILEDPAAANAKYTPVSDPKESGLLISPSKLIIPAKQSRTIRVSSITAPGLLDKIYSIHIREIDNTIFIPKEKESNGINATIRVNVGYGVLVVVRPIKTNIKIDLKRTGKTLEVTNHSNTRIDLNTGSQCDLGTENCVAVKGRGINAGETRTLSLAKDLPVSYFVSYPGAKKGEKLQSN